MTRLVALLLTLALWLAVPSPPAHAAPLGKLTSTMKRRAAAVRQRIGDFSYRHMGDLFLGSVVGSAASLATVLLAKAPRTKLEAATIGGTLLLSAGWHGLQILAELHNPTPGRRPR